MPRGKWTNHKGRGRHFTNPEALEEERRREEAKKARDRRRQYREEGDSSSENEERHKKGGWSGSGESGSESETDSESDAESDSESEPEVNNAQKNKYKKTKGKGVEKLIEISNPNRVQKKTKKLSTLNESLATSGKTELSRREREELEKQAAEARHQKLHAEGRTEEARADLARLAIIKAQREEAAMKRKLEKLQKEELLKSKQEAIGKALGKRT